MIWIGQGTPINKTGQACSPNLLSAKHRAPSYRRKHRISALPWRMRAHVIRLRRRPPLDPLRRIASIALDLHPPLERRFDVDHGVVILRQLGPGAVDAL